MLTWFPVVFWSRSNGNQNLVHPYTLDDPKVAGHGRQPMNNLMIWTICKYKDLPKFARLWFSPFWRRIGGFNLKSQNKVW